MNNHMNNIFDEENKRMRYTILKLLGIVSLGVAGIGALGAGVGLALGAFGISMGIPVVGSALVTAGSWFATAIPALGVALPIALGAIAGIGVVALAVWGIYKLVKSFSKSKDFPPKIKVKEPLKEPPQTVQQRDKNIKINKELTEEKSKKDVKIEEKKPEDELNANPQEEPKIGEKNKNLNDNNNIINNINNNNNDINIKKEDKDRDEDKKNKNKKIKDININGERYEAHLDEIDVGIDDTNLYLNVLEKHKDLNVLFGDENLKKGNTKIKNKSLDRIAQLCGDSPALVEMVNFNFYKEENKGK